MAIRKIDENDLPSVVPLLKSYFPKHNRFNKPESEVIDYLKDLMHKPSYQSISHETPMYIYEEDSKVKGFLALVHFDGTSDGTHKVWKFKHFAFESEDIASKLLAEAEKIARKSSKTAKIELTIAETEKGIKFYKSNGYKQEGALKNHYRFGETCFILSKSFK